MPLCTSITDAGSDSPRRLPHGWGWWHVECMTDVLRREDPKATGKPILEAWSHNETPGRHVVQFAVSYRDPSDGEVLTLNPGDVLHVWREW